MDSFWCIETIQKGNCFMDLNKNENLNQTCDIVSCEVAPGDGYREYRITSLRYVWMDKHPS